MAGLRERATTRNRRSPVPLRPAVSTLSQALDAAEPLLSDHPLELIFTDHRHAQLTGLVKLAPRLCPRDHIIRLLADAAARPSAIFLDRRLNFLATVFLQRA